MQYTDERCEILSNRQITDGIFDLTVKADYLAQNAGCGQFANILCGGLMLRRPISICDTDPKAGTARFVYQVKGKGTAWLSQQPAGASLQIFGPLGRGFSFIKKPAQVVLIGGGIGSPPMLKTATVLEGNMRAAAAKGFINATDCADYLTKKGVPFRDAYKVTGQLVGYCIEKGTTLEELPLSVYKEFSDVFEEDVYAAIDLTACAMNRRSYGGPAEEGVKGQLEKLAAIFGEGEME